MKRFKTVATLLCALTLAVGAVAFSACGSGDEGVIKGNYKEATALEMINAVKAVDEDKLFTPEEGKDALGYELKASAKLGASYGGGTLGEQFELNANAKAEFKLALKQNEANGISASSAGSVSFKLKSSLKQLNSLNADAELYTDDSNVYVGASIKTVADGAEDSSSFKYKIPFTTIGDIIGGIGGMNGFAEEDIYGELGLEGIVSIAVMAGFKSYIEMAYLANGHYYYGADEVAAFRRQVVEELVPVAARLYEQQKKRIKIDKLHYYDEQLVFPEGNAAPVGDVRYMVESARKMYRELSAETGEFFDFMCEHELFDLETRAGKHMGGYCTFISGYNAPFIFSNFNGTSADVDVLTHEAGHAFQAYSTAKNVTLSSQLWSTSEISEIHSMSMEHFAYPWMDLFFGENADKYRYAHLSDALKTVPYLCLVDHFQQEVFSHDYDAKGLRECWRRLEKIYMPWRDYDGNGFLEEGGFWMQKQHIFMYPFYYVDYALAQMGAFEYFTRAKADKAGAWKDYYALCRAGGSKSYFELLKLGGLSNPFEKGSVKKAISGVVAELEKNNF